MNKEPKFPPKSKIEDEEAKQIKAKLKELFAEEVWLNSEHKTLVFCSNSHLQHPYVLEVLSKKKLYLQMDLFNEEN